MFNFIICCFVLFFMCIISHEICGKCHGLLRLSVNEVIACDINYNKYQFHLLEEEEPNEENTIQFIGFEPQNTLIFLKCCYLCGCNLLGKNTKIYGPIVMTHHYQQRINIKFYTDFNECCDRCLLHNQ